MGKSLYIAGTKGSIFLPLPSVGEGRVRDQKWYGPHFFVKKWGGISPSRSKISYSGTCANGNGKAFVQADEPPILLFAWIL